MQLFFQRCNKKRRMHMCLTETHLHADHALKAYCEMFENYSFFNRKNKTSLFVCRTTHRGAYILTPSNYSLLEFGLRQIIMKQSKITYIAQCHSTHVVHRNNNTFFFFFGSGWGGVMTFSKETCCGIFKTDLGS